MEYLEMELKPILMLDGNGEQQLAELANLLSEADLILIDINKNYDIKGFRYLEMSALQFGLRHALNAVELLLNVDLTL